MDTHTSDNEQTILVQPDNQLPPFTMQDMPETIRTAAIGLKWTSLMPVQAQAIPYLLADRDMIVQSRTGSGKTGAFLIPILMKVDPSHSYPQALVLVPTRELASQVYREFEALSAGMGVRGALVYGGVGYGAQMDALRGGAHVVIGTPGRVLDHLGRRSLSLDRLRVMVFDEADEMLSMGFYPAMRELRRYLPRERRSWMFSATMPYKVQSLAQEFLKHPEFLSLSAGHEAVTTMEHRYYSVPAMDKDIILMRLIEMENPESAIIFCNTKAEVEFLSAALQNHGYNADQLSGDLDQKARELAMSRIRRRQTRFLVATDVAARGIDISDLAFVFQYDMPKDTESYIHRAGRTARAGNTGVVVTLVANMSEKGDVKKVARKHAVEFVELPAPTQEEVEQRIAERMIVLLEDRLRHKKSRAEQLRIKRFDPLVQSLSESEDERKLLAMLLDEIYHAEFHAASPEMMHVEERAPQQPDRQPNRQPDRQPDRQRERAPEPVAVDGGDAGPVEKKKKKRRRSRGKKGGGEEAVRREGEGAMGAEESGEGRGEKGEGRGEKAKDEGGSIGDAAGVPETAESSRGNSRGIEASGVEGPSIELPNAEASRVESPRTAPHDAASASNEPVGVEAEKDEATTPKKPKTRKSKTTKPVVEAGDVDSPGGEDAVAPERPKRARAPRKKPAASADGRGDSGSDAAAE